MIALLIIIYTSVVLVLFKVLRLKPTAYLIAGLLLAGILLIGGVVVAWALSAPISEKLVTSQYVIQLVPYVKGQVKVVHAQANQPMKKGDILLEIDPTPYQYTVNQMQAALEQAKATVANAKASLDSAIAADDLAKTKEKDALGTQRAFAGAISTQDVAVAVQTRIQADGRFSRRRPPSSRQRATFRRSRRSWTMRCSTSINARCWRRATAMS